MKEKLKADRIRRKQRCQLQVKKARQIKNYQKEELRKEQKTYKKMFFKGKQLKKEPLKTKKRSISTRPL